MPGVGVEPWTSDGTEAGTVLLEDIHRGAGSSRPDSLVGARGTLFFTASTPGTGRELWRSDGTEAGTTLVKDVTPGLSWSAPTPLATANGFLFFGAAGALWRTAGTEAGTVMVRDAVLPQHPWYGCGGLFAVVNDALVFAGRDENGCEPWRSDGFTAEPLADLDPGPASSMGPVFRSSLRGLGRLVVFSAYSESHGVELWATDGVGAPLLVQDVEAGAAWSAPGPFTPAGRLVYFPANGAATGNELWAIRRAALRRALGAPELDAAEAQAQDDEAPPRRRGLAAGFQALLPASELGSWEGMREREGEP